MADIYRLSAVARVSVASIRMLRCRLETGAAGHNQCLVEGLNVVNRRLGKPVNEYNTWRETSNDESNTNLNVGPEQDERQNACRC